MAESTLEAPTVPESSTADQAFPREPVPWTLRAYIREHPWVTTVVGIIALSTLLAVWARTRPSYDAYGWLVWGYQTLHLSLNLGGAPSWKPLPFLFTVPFALAGHYELWLWMITAIAISLAGAVFAGRIAYRVIAGDPEGPGRSSVAGNGSAPAGNGSARAGGLGRAAETADAVDPARRDAALIGAVFAGCALLGLEDYMHYILSVQSDPMIVTFVLAGIDCHLSKRYRWAWGLLFLAALGRPEAWPFTGLYAIWAWWRIPSMRWMLYAGIALIAFLWFGIPTITNHRPDIAGQLALESPRELKQNRVFGTIGRFTELEYLPVWIAALCTVAVALVRRNRLVLGLAAGCVGWVVIEIAFAFHGWPALSRYMFEPAAVAVALAGVGVGWTLLELPKARRGLPRWVGISVVVVLVATLIPGALARVRTERTDLRHERDRTHEIALLNTTISALGGYRHVRDCGEPVTNVEYVSTLAWFTKLDVGLVGHRPDFELHQKYPIVLFTPLSRGGWNVLPWHTRRAQVSSCLGLHATYAGGVLAHH